MASQSYHKVLAHITCDEFVRYRTAVIKDSSQRLRQELSRYQNHLPAADVEQFDRSRLVFYCVQLRHATGSIAAVRDTVENFMPVAYARLTGSTSSDFSDIGSDVGEDVVFRTGNDVTDTLRSDVAASVRQTSDLTAFMMQMFERQEMLRREQSDREERLRQEHLDLRREQLEKEERLRQEQADREFRPMFRDSLTCRPMWRFMYDPR